MSNSSNDGNNSMLPNKYYVVLNFYSTSGQNHCVKVTNTSPVVMTGQGKYRSYQQDKDIVCEYPQPMSGNNYGKVMVGHKIDTFPADISFYSHANPKIKGCCGILTQYEHMTGKNWNGIVSKDHNLEIIIKSLNGHQVFGKFDAGRVRDLLFVDSIVPIELMDQVLQMDKKILLVPENKFGIYALDVLCCSDDFYSILEIFTKPDYAKYYAVVKRLDIYH